MQILTRIAVVVLFALSPSILDLVGVGYSSGNPIFGIHISTYAFLLAAAVPLLSRPGQAVEKFLKYPPASLYTLAVCAILIPVLFIKGDVGFRMTIVAVTYASPAILLFLLMNSDRTTIRFLSWFLTGFMVLNSTIGFFEYATGQRLIPFTIGLETITFDPRPCALLAHPLYNALLTGAFLLSLLILAIKKGASAWTLAGIAFFTASMFTFGGRTALVSVFLVFALYAIYQAVLAALYMRAQKSVLRSTLLVASLAIAAPVVLASPVAAMMLDRFSNSHSSDTTRVVAINMLAGLSPQEMMIGLDTATQIALQAQLGTTRGIELSWISLIIHFGLPAAAALIVAMIVLLWSSANRNRDQLFLVLFFVIVTFGSLSIGSRSLLISQTMVIMFCGPLAMYGLQRSANSGRAYRVVKRRVARPPKEDQATGDAPVGA